MTDRLLFSYHGIRQVEETWVKLLFLNPVHVPGSPRTRIAILSERKSTSQRTINRELRSRDARPLARHTVWTIYLVSQPVVVGDGDGGVTGNNGQGTLSRRRRMLARTRRNGKLIELKLHN